MGNVEVIEDVFDMSSRDCDHPKVEIDDPLSGPGSKVSVDAVVASLVVAMGDAGPSLACGEQMQEPDESEATFVFADRSEAASFIAELGDFGRSGNFEVYFKRDHIRVSFPLDWVDGLAERYRRNKARWLEEIRAAHDTVPRERRPPHSTVTPDGIEIDEELAPLIRKLWEAGIRTTMYRQEREPGICSIRFLSPGDAMKFLGPASLVLSECHWRLDDRHEVDDDFEANPLGRVSIEFRREDLGALIRMWGPGPGDRG
jgi:hypothetical protein